MDKSMKSVSATRTYSDAVRGHSPGTWPDYQHESEEEAILFATKNPLTVRRY